MSHSALVQLVDWTILSMKSDDQPSDDALQALRILLPDNVIVAAFDLIDRRKVFRYKTSWGRSFYEVFGSRRRYSVSVDLPSPTPAYCACPAFAYNVLLTDNQVMCKHVLAVKLARRIDKCVERTITQDELVLIVCPDLDPEFEEVPTLSIAAG